MKIGLWNSASTSKWLAEYDMEEIILKKAK